MLFYLRYAVLQERVALESDIAARDQLLLWHDTDLAELVEPTAAVCSYPKSITDARIYIINKQLMESSTLKTLFVRKFMLMFTFRHVK